MANRFILNETSYHGKGAIKEIPNEIKARGFKKAFVASDPDLIKFGVTKKVTDLLDEAGIEYVIYSNIQPNPTIENVQTGVKAYAEAGADVIVAIGGGSSMDTSKAIGIINTNPEFADVRSLEGASETTKPCTPILAVPTTAGTAAEVTINYVITDPENKRKFVCCDPHDIPVVALSDMFHIKAIQLIAKNLRAAVKNDPVGREQMALAQYIAGMGFSNVGLGVDHAMAHTLSAYYGMPHGKACATLLPTVMAYNADATGEKYRDIAAAFDVEGAYTKPLEEVRELAVAAVKQLGEDVGIQMSLKGVVPMEDIDALSADAAKDACAPGNPKPASIEDIKAMFLSLM